MASMAHQTFQVPMSYSANSVPIPPRRMPPTTGSATSLAFNQNSAIHNLTGRAKHIRSSRTWTSSSGEVALMSDTDELDDRTLFIQEYNRLAQKHGVRPLIVDDFNTTNQTAHAPSPEKRGWLYRMFRSTSGSLPVQKPPISKSQPHIRQRRSVSDFAHNLVALQCRQEAPKVLDLQAMVRISGKSVLYLPQDFAPSCLVLPTCLRAMAQNLSQHVTTRGIFRIPGSVRIVNSLFDYYCYAENGGSDISNTVRCANLPVHIQSSVHDVASTFKRMLSVLPGGILGSLSIFDSFVAVHSHLRGDPEFPRTKQTKVRARLLALAIGSIESQFRRELICAVFGLLSLIGRAAEVAPREDEDGRPLPTSDLMGYGALGIVFGPLLVGDLLNQYRMNFVTPNSGLVLFPISPRRLRKGRRKSSNANNSTNGPPSIDKIYVSNSVAEMLISNWRDVVRQMRSLGMNHRKDVSLHNTRTGSLRPSISESCITKRPEEWNEAPGIVHFQGERGGSPETVAPSISLKRQRPYRDTSLNSNRLRSKHSKGVLSPTVEESTTDAETFENDNKIRWHTQKFPRTSGGGDPSADIHTDNDYNIQDQSLGRHNSWQTFVSAEEQPKGGNSQQRRRLDVTRASAEVSIDEIPPRVSSKHGSHLDDAVSGFQTEDSKVEFAPGSTELFSPRSQSKRPSAVNLDSPDEREGKRGSVDPNLRPRVLSDRSARLSTQNRQESLPVSERVDRVSISNPVRKNFVKEEKALPDNFISLAHVGNDVFTSPKTKDRQRSTIGSETKGTFDIQGKESRPVKGEENQVRHRGSATSWSTVGIDDYTGTSQFQDAESFYLGPNGNIEGSIQSRAPDTASRSSISTTPVHFYAPMRVPAALTASAISFQPESARRLGSYGAMKPRKDEKPERSKIGDERSEHKDASGFLHSGRQSWKISTLSRERLRQFDPDVEPKPASLKSIPGTHRKTNPTPAFSQFKDVSPPVTRVKSQANPSIRDNTSDAGSIKTPGVKAMAARFEVEGEAPSKPLPTRSIIAGRDLSFLSLESQSAQSSPVKSLRESKSAPIREAESLKGPSWSAKGGEEALASTPRKTTPEKPDEGEGRNRGSWSSKSLSTPKISSTIDDGSMPPQRASWSVRSMATSPVGTEPKSNQPGTLRVTPPNLPLRSSVSEGVAARAAAILEAEKQHQGPSTVRMPLAGLRQPGAWKKPSPEAPKDFQSQMKVASSLGTMVPPQEQPPVAQHLNFARPPSALSDHPPVPLAATPIPRPGSTTFLHGQIRNLQRQVEAKSEEIIQLRRQVDAQENSDVGTLSQQLREAKQEAQMWKERAEAAERRVKVFERFTARLKGIRQAAAVADERARVQSENPQGDFLSSEDASGGEEEVGTSHVRFLEGHARKRGTSSTDSGKTEDAGVVTARIKKCLHGGHGPGHSAAGCDGSSSPYESSVNLRAMEIWRAAQELLEETGL